MIRKELERQTTVAPECVRDSQSENENYTSFRALNIYSCWFIGARKILFGRTRDTADRKIGTRTLARTISIPWLNVSHSMLITSFNCKWQNTILFAMLYETISQKIGLFQRVSYASTHKSMRASKWKPDYRRLWCGGDDDHELIIIFSVLLTGLFVVGNFSN